jgi:hypothetical protein
MHSLRARSLSQAQNKVNGQAQQAALSKTQGINAQSPKKYASQSRNALNKPVKEEVDRHFNGIKGLPPFFFYSLDFYYHLCATPNAQVLELVDKHV